MKKADREMLKKYCGFEWCQKELLSKRAEKTNSTVLKSHQAVSVMLQIAAHSGVGNTSLLVSNKVKENVLKLAEAAGLRTFELSRSEFRVPKNATLIEFDWF